MRTTLFIFFLLVVKLLPAQYYTFNRFSTEDGTGLSSNNVRSVYQDEKGFIWVGTANGLQRFDGKKFVEFIMPPSHPGRMPNAALSQIIPLDSGRLFLCYAEIKTFGIFNPADFSYKKIDVKTNRSLSPRAEYVGWKDAYGNLYLNILHNGILQYDKKQNAFVDANPFNIPKGWIPTLHGMYDDAAKQQVWICTDSGLCIYNRQSNITWTRNNNPQSLPILKNERVQDRMTEIYIDKKRRIWVFSWPTWGGGGQYKFCLDSTGANYLNKDTIGLNKGPVGYTEYRHLYETKNGNLWIYGLDALFNYSGMTKTFQFHKSGVVGDNTNITYQVVHQVIEDKDGGIWVATDQGLYFTSLGFDAYSVLNIAFDNKNTATDLNDILEMPNGDRWFTSWGTGVISMDSLFMRTTNYVYTQPPPAGWTDLLKRDTKNTWCLERQAETGRIWIGCNSGILLIHDPAKHTTQYLRPEEINNSTIRFIVEDKHQQMWLSTQGGRLLKYSNGKFDVVFDIGTIIYKIFIDNEGLLWITTHEKGLYVIDPATGDVKQHYYADHGNNSTYSNTAYDIEQLNDSIIVYGAGVLNFINKRTQTVKLITYADGLPSNSVARLRMDKNGFLWIITANGLCRYNPINHRISPYGKKDGIVFGEKTSAADLRLSNGYLVFAGGNSIVMFHPAVYSINQPPPPVTITDFKIFNNFQPLDSLLQSGEIKLSNSQNSFSIFYASLSFIQRDRLSYYYKMEGLDKDWISAGKITYVNYPLLPPGKYVFKVYCENIEGQRSAITELHIFIKPPIWATKWFMSSVLFLIALIIYAVHAMRVRRLMAVEKLRTRVARDLHDDMGSTLSTINILSAMAKSKMTSDAVKTTEYLAKITDNSQRMMDAMDDIVWSIKPANDSMQKIVARMREFATNVLEPKDIELLFDVDEPVYDIKLNMEARRDFFLIFKEAVNNAAKYSKAAQVKVKMEVQAKIVTLTVCDDGKGFDVAKADGGNGLGNMQKRADAMQGKLTIRSAETGGTTVRLIIPVIFRPAT